MTQQSISSIPASVLRFEPSDCGGALKGSLKIDTVMVHVEAVRVAELGVVDLQELPPDTPQTVAWHTSAAGMEELSEDGDPFCACQQMVDDIYTVNKDYRGNFMSGSVGGRKGEWLITATPFQQ